VSTRWSLGTFVKSTSDWYSLHWSEAEHYRCSCQWMAKTSPCLCSHSGPTLKANLLQAVKNGQLHEMSAVESEMWTKCVFIHMLIKQSHWIKRWYFAGCVFPRYCRNKRWVRWETEWSFDDKLCQEYSGQKLSKSDNGFASYSQKCWGSFLWDTL